MMLIVVAVFVFGGFAAAPEIGSGRSFIVDRIVAMIGLLIVLVAAILTALFLFVKLGI